MGILKEQTVGNVKFAWIDDVYPSFNSAEKIIAINKDGRLFSNVPNSTMWFPYTTEQYGGEMYENVRGVSRATSSFTVASDNLVWYLPGTIFTFPQTNDLNGFVKSTFGTTTVLSAETNTIGRFLCSGEMGIGLDSGDQTNYEISPTYGNIAPGDGANGHCAADATWSDSVASSKRVIDINGGIDDFIGLAFRVYNGPAIASTFGTVRFSLARLSAMLLEEPSFIVDEDWSSGSFGDWTTVNGGNTNKWIVGTGTSKNDTYSAYISNDNDTNAYTSSSTGITHFYKEITFPENSNDSRLQFWWKSNGATATGGGAPSFSDLGWTVSNPPTDAWEIGTAEASTGTNSAYMSLDGGTTANYSATAGEVSYFYRDVEMPTGGTMDLIFDWKCDGENSTGVWQYDFGTVYIVPTGTTLVGQAHGEVSAQGTGELNESLRLGAATNQNKFNDGYIAAAATTWQTETISVDSFATGCTNTLAFAFRADTTSIDNPPGFCVDNIKLSSSTDGLLVDTDFEDLPPADNEVVGKVYLIPTSAGTPTLDVEPDSSYQVGVDLVSQTDWQSFDLNLDDSTRKGKSYYLTFSWVHKADRGTTPPTAIDQIRFYSYPTVLDDKT
jgi:hypothetical protein